MNINFQKILELVKKNKFNDALNKIGQIDLESYKAIGIGGLNSYYKLKHIESFPYVKLNEIPHFDE